MQSDNYCAAPFVHMVRHYDGEIRPCCLWQSHKTDDHWLKNSPEKPSASDPDPFGSDWMEFIRSSMLANEPLPGCSLCRSREKISGGMRIWFNENYGRPVEATLQYLEFNLGNLCNMKCRMCSSLDSTRWIADELTLGKIPYSPVRAKIRDFQSYANSIDRLKLIGGEPSLEQELIIEILDLITSERGNLNHLSISLITNAMIRFNDELLTKLSRCKNVRLECSIDGIGAVNDYIRSGSVWDKIHQNLLWYQANLPANFTLWTVSIWSILNIEHAVDLLRFVAADLPRYKSNGIAVVHPTQLDLRNLPRSYKDDVIRSIDSWEEYDSVPWMMLDKNVIRSRLNLDAELSSEEVLNFIINLDRIRNEDFARLSPQLHSALTGS